MNALELARVVDPVTGRLLTLGDPESGQSSGLCPGTRPGASLRGQPSITPVGSGVFGCCTGYRPRQCTADADCADLSVTFTHVSPFGGSTPTTIAGRCANGVCERPPGCPDGTDFAGSDCPAAAGRYVRRRRA